MSRGGCWALMIASDCGRRFFNVINSEIGPEGISWALVKEVKMEATKQHFWCSRLRAQTAWL